MISIGFFFFRKPNSSTTLLDEKSVLLQKKKEIEMNALIEDAGLPSPYFKKISSKEKKTTYLALKKERGIIEKFVKSQCGSWNSIDGLRLDGYDGFVKSADIQLEKPYFGSIEILVEGTVDSYVVIYAQKENGKFSQIIKLFNKFPLIQKFEIPFKTQLLRIQLRITHVPLYQNEYIVIRALRPLSTAPLATE